MDTSSDWETYPFTCFWSQLKSANQNPRTRFKHATCIHGNYVYMSGGKDATKPLKDFWRFHLKNNDWEEVETKGLEIGHLQGHTLSPYKRLILIFGGEFSNTNENASLLIYNPDLNHLRRYIGDGSNQPSGRREHTSIIYNDKLYIYGGFNDIKGSIGELWQYSIDEEEWQLLPQPTRNHPGSRHAHTACLHGNSMWIFGGMSDLTVKNDLWQYNFVLQKWFQHKLLNGPSSLSGHSAVIVGSNMLIFGGVKHGHISPDIWSLHIDSLTWSKIEQDNTAALPPLTQHTAIVVSSSKSQTTDQNNRTASVPQLQRKKIRASQYSLPDRPKSSPSHNIHSTSVNFHNKIFPVDDTSVEEFELATLDASRGVNSHCQIVHNPQIDEKPLLTDSLSNISVGVDNRANDILEMENVGTEEKVQKRDKPKRFSKKSEEHNFYDLCSQCKMSRNYSQPTERHNDIYRSNCVLCSRPLRHSRHESDITIEDLERLDNDIKNHEDTLSNSFKAMQEYRSCQENIEMKDFNSEQCSGDGKCDVISMCHRCHSSHVCHHSDGYCGSVEESFITSNVVSIATQTDINEGRNYTATERKYLYQSPTDDVDSGIDDENNYFVSDKVEILVFGGKSVTRNTVEVSPITVWKLTIPY